MLSRCWMLLWVLVPAFTEAEISSDRVYRKGYGQRLGAVPQAVGEDYPDEGEVIPSFAEPVQNITVPRGRDAKIACIIENLGDFRPAWIKEKDKAILTMHQQIISRNYRISLSTSDNRVFTLHIRNVQESDRGGYMCQINTSPVKSSTGYLDVLVPPDILVEQSSSDVVVREGANVSLVCKARGYPTPSISWRREDGEPIPLGGYKQPTNNKLHTLVSPVIWIPQQLVGVAPRHNVSLDCHSEAYPLSTIHWSKEGTRLSGEGSQAAKYHIESKRTSSYKIRSVLTIRDMQPTDYGFYKCVSENVLGFTESSAQIYEVSPARSSSTQESMVEDDEDDDDATYGMGTPEKSYSDGALRSISNAVITLPCVLVALLNIS